MACLFAGPWKRATALGGKISDLDITSEDCFSLLAEHKLCPQVSIHLNYLETPGSRKITAVWEDGGAYLDFIAGVLRWGSEEEFFHPDRDETYRRQMQCLLDGQVDRCCSFAQGIEVVSFIAAVESAARQKEWVCRINQ